MYILYFYLLYPLLMILAIFRPKSHKILVIQTAKIGDYANSSVIFDLASANGANLRFDIVLDRPNLAFASCDKRIERTFVINDYKKGLKKLVLAFYLFKRGYKKVYVLMPNNYNLFLAKCTLANKIITISHYKNSSAFWGLSDGAKIIKHNKSDLSLLTYLKMFDVDFSKLHSAINEAQNAALNSDDYYISKLNLPYKKCLQSPLCVPKNEIALDESAFKIGISLSAGNKIKTITSQTWGEIFKILRGFGGIKVYIFGVGDELKYLEGIDIAGLELISLVDQIPLNELPFYISKMQVYISSDTGNYYIADTMGVNTICFMGPCYGAEQRGVHNSLVIKSHLEPFTAVFDTIYNRDASEYFSLNDAQKTAINDFISALISQK